MAEDEEGGGVTTRKDAIAEIERIIEENAGLLQEEPNLRVRVREKGWVRVYWLRDDGRVDRTQYREYRSLDLALAAARQANRRARAVASKMAAGVPKAHAIATTPFEWLDA